MTYCKVNSSLLMAATMTCSNPHIACKALFKGTRGKITSLAPGTSRIPGL